MSQLVWAGKGAEEESLAFFKTHSEFPQVSNFDTTLFQIRQIQSRSTEHVLLFDRYEAAN